MVAWWWSFCRDLGDGGPGGGFVHDGFAGGVRGDEGLDGEVVDRAGDAAADLVDQGDRVVGEQCVRAPGQGEVVGEVAFGLGGAHLGQGVAQRDALVPVSYTHLRAHET